LGNQSPHFFKYRDHGKYDRSYLRLLEFQK
jgi:hypothetical protein